jgi:hypothetical protein
MNPPGRRIRLARVLFCDDIREKEETPMTEEQLDKFRVEGTKVRVVRDALEMNDVVGFVVAWDDESVLIRRPNRRVVKLKRDYVMVEASAPRPSVEGILK